MSSSLKRIAAVAALFAIPALALSTAANAQARGGLELTPGAYVLDGRDCASADAFRFDGQVLTAAGAKTPWRDTGHAWIRAVGPDSFKLTERRSHPAGKAAPALRAKTYRLCAANGA